MKIVCNYIHWQPLTSDSNRAAEESQDTKAKKKTVGFLAEMLNGMFPLVLLTAPKL